MDNYLFQAAPKPVQTRTKKQIYREPEEQKESLAKTNNLMYDRRVARGSTYAPSKRTQPLAAGPFRPIPVANRAPPPAAAASRPRREEMQHPLPPSSAAPAMDRGEVEYMRVATPEPVAGRTHCTVQTDTYLEDLRRNKHTQEHDFATQTDPENDRPTQPLFIPRSSGDDVATEIEQDALFDFELEVQSILNVLVEKTLEQSLMEVCEEEELAELAHHQATFQQQKNTKLVAVQQIVQRDERRKAERERRKKQEEERLAEEKRTQEKQQAATIAKRLVEHMEEEIIQRLTEQGAFYDPVKKEVEKVFMPYLLSATAEKLAAYHTATQVLDDCLESAISEYKQDVELQAQAQDERQVELLVAHALDPLTHPKPPQPVIATVTRVGLEEERSRRSGIQGRDSRLAQSSSGSRVPPEVRAEKIVSSILSERAAAKAAEEKRLQDIIKIQSLQRARRDRARVEKLAEKRRKEALRAAMSPQELLVSLRSHAGLQLKLLPIDMLAEDSTPDLRISKIDARGPAAQAGLVLGDRILAVNGSGAYGPESLTNDSLKAAGLHPGETVALSVMRMTTDARTETVQLELTTDEEGYTHDAIRALRAEAELPPSEQAWLSKEEALEAVQKLSGKLGATTAEQQGGAKLTKIAEGSAAARAGLKDGQIIVIVNGEPVSDHKAFTAACKDTQAGDIMELEVLTPTSQEKVAAGSAINLRSMSTTKVKVELGGGGKKYSVEAVRGLRRIAGLPVFGEQ